MCPIAIYKELLVRRPANAPDKLYLATSCSGSRKKGNFTRGPLFKAAPLGINEIKTFMHVICAAAGIPDRSNHSLRATGISNCYAAGMPEDQIQKKSRHRSEEGVRKYNQ